MHLRRDPEGAVHVFQAPTSQEDVLPAAIHPHPRAGEQEAVQGHLDVGRPEGGKRADLVPKQERQGRASPGRGPPARDPRGQRVRPAEAHRGRLTQDQLCQPA